MDRKSTMTFRGRDAFRQMAREITRRDHQATLQAAENPLRVRDLIGGGS